MIDPRLEEQAALHVLGALDEREAREFQAVLRQNHELQSCVARLNQVTGALAGAVPHVAPPAHCRENILRQISQPARPASPTPASSSAWLVRLPWLLASGLAVACVVLVCQNRQQTQTVRQQAGQIQSLSMLANQLQAATNRLQQSVLTLQENNRLANLRIAMLNSQLAAAPSAIGVTLWDEQGQQGEFVAQNLKPLPNGKDYQLWVIDPNYQTPVSAGVFQVNPQGVGRVSFKANRLIRIAGKFAVTEEPKGGQATPSLDHLVLMGG